MSVSWQMARQDVVYHAMEYYSATKKNKLLTHAVSWINFKNMLSERSQTQDNTLWFHFYEMPRKGNFIEMESRLEVAWC